MRNKIFFAVFFILGFFASFLYFQNKTQTAPEKTCIEKKTISENEVRIYAQKLKLLESLNPTTVYFTYKINNVSTDTKRIDIFLLGGETMTVDGADLQLHHDISLQVVEIKAGKAFPIYPRLLSQDNTIFITGIASLKGDSIQFGKPNELFASITVKTKTQSSITIDKQNTKAYLLGNSVIDLKKTFETIPL